MKVLKINRLIFALLYALPLLQFYFEVSLKIGNFFLGTAPIVILYLGWMYYLVSKFGGSFNPKKIRALLTFSMILQPIIVYLINLTIKVERLSILVNPIMGLLGLFLLFVVIYTWLFIAKTLFIVINNKRNPNSVFFPDYIKYFFLILGGPFTLWWLGGAIIRADERINKN